jgi:hypothetical protein
MPNQGGTIIDGATAADTLSKRLQLWGAKHTFMATGETSASTGAAIIKIQVSNADSPSATAVSGDSAGDWVDAGTITLALTTTNGGGALAIDAPYRFARAWVSAISGTGATVDVTYGRTE